MAAIDIADAADNGNVAALTAALVAGDVTSTELVEEYLARIERSAGLNTLITLARHLTQPPRCRDCRWPIKTFFAPKAS